MACRSDSRDDVPVDAATRDRIADALCRLVEDRGAGKTICPSEAARALAENQTGDQAWRAWMPAVRAVAAELADSGRLIATQRGASVNINQARGPIRLGRAGRADAKKKPLE